MSSLLDAAGNRHTLSMSLIEGVAVSTHNQHSAEPHIPEPGEPSVPELEGAVTVRSLQHRDVGVVAVEADGSVGPLAADRVAADDFETEVGEEGDRCFEVANGDADVLKFDGHALHATARL